MRLDTTKIPAQRTFMEATNPEILYSGAFGAGKSRIGCEKIYFLCGKYPGNKALIVRKTFSSLKTTTMDTWFRFVCPKERIVSYNKQEHLVTLDTGSEVLFAGLDKASRIGSFEAGAIFADETIEFTEEEYLMLLGRLRFPNVPFHQLMGATNPDNPYHWLHNRFYNSPELKQSGQVLTVEASAHSNPFTPETYKQSLSTFKGKYYQRYVLGNWISFEGLVYDNWDTGKHVIPRNTTFLGLTGDVKKPIPSGSDWLHYRSMDFGFTNPFVCQWWATQVYKYIGEEGSQDRVEIPPSERIYIRYKEIYFSGRPVTEHAKTIVDNTDYKVEASFADWDAGDRAILAQAGIPTVSAKKDVSAGIQTVYHMISNDQVYLLQDSTVEVDQSLESASKPTSSEQEFYSYNRPKSRTNVANAKEDPIKLDDHGMDTIRYILHTLQGSMGLSSQIQTTSVTDSISVSTVENKQPEPAEVVAASMPGSKRQVMINSHSSPRPSWRAMSPQI